MKKIEYTFNELESEAVRFSFAGQNLFSMGGPEETLKSGIFWSPAINNDWQEFDLYWIKGGCFGDWDFYTLQSAQAACLG